MAGNAISDKGAASLSEVLKCCSKLATVYLSGELFGRLSVQVGVAARGGAMVECSR